MASATVVSLSLGFYMAPFFGKKPTFWEYLSVPSSGSQDNTNLETQMMGQRCSPETFVSYQKMMLGKNPKAFLQQIQG
jgi:hypothetical protein